MILQITQRNKPRMRAHEYSKIMNNNEVVIAS